MGGIILYSKNKVKFKENRMKIQSNRFSNLTTYYKNKTQFKFSDTEFKNYISSICVYLILANFIGLDTSCGYRVSEKKSEVIEGYRRNWKGTPKF